MAPHSSTLAWKIPWMEEPGRLQSMGLQRVGHDWVTSLSLFTFMHWRRKWQPTPVFLPGESQGWGSLIGCRLWGRTESDRLKQLSSSSSCQARGGPTGCCCQDCSGFLMFTSNACLFSLCSGLRQILYTRTIPSFLSLLDIFPPIEDMVSPRRGHLILYC